MMKLSVVTGIFIALLSALAAERVSAQEFSMPVTDDFVESEIGVNAGMPKPYYYSWRLSRQNGRLVLCGSGAFNNFQLRRTVRDMMRNARIEMGGQMYEVDASFFTVVRRRQDISTSTATCRVLPISIPRNPGVIQFGPGRGTFRG